MTGGELFGHAHSVRAFVTQVKHSFVKQMFDQRLTSNSRSWHATNSRSSNVCSIQKGRDQLVALAVVIPGQFGDRRFGNGQFGTRSFGEVRPASQIYARRRLMAAFVLVAIVLVLLVGTGHVVANRGGAPASASTVRPATPAAASAPAQVYVVQAGDTLWSIGQRFHGRAGLADYVDALVSANGGTRLQVSQAITLP